MNYEKLNKCLKKVGIPLQCSIFSVDATNEKMGTLISQLATLIDPRVDDVRAYRLPEKGWRATLGDAMLPNDMWIK